MVRAVIAVVLVCRPCVTEQGAGRRKKAVLAGLDKVHLGHLKGRLKVENHTGASRRGAAEAFPAPGRLMVGTLRHTPAVCRVGPTCLNLA